jgi:hypothetical protein
MAILPNINSHLRLETKWNSLADGGREHRDLAVLQRGGIHVFKKYKKPRLFITNIKKGKTRVYYGTRVCLNGPLDK